MKIKGGNNLHTKLIERRLREVGNSNNTTKNKRGNTLIGKPH